MIIIIFKSTGTEDSTHIRSHQELDQESYPQTYGKGLPLPRVYPRLRLAMDTCFAASCPLVKNRTGWVTRNVTVLS